MEVAVSPEAVAVTAPFCCQLAVLIACEAPAMNSRTTATLIITMTSLTVADSLMPTTSSVVTSAMMTMAGRLSIAVMVVPSGSAVVPS